MRHMDESQLRMGSIYQRKKDDADQFKLGQLPFSAKYLTAEVHPHHSGEDQCQKVQET